MRTYLKVIAQRIFGDGAWEEVSGNRLLFKCLSVLSALRKKKKKVAISSRYSLMIKITHFLEKEADETCSNAKYTFKIKWTVVAVSHVWYLV